MRVLLLFRGAPGVGKSTFIKEHGLESYTLSPDTIRLQCQSPVLDIHGKQCIGMNFEKFVWKTLFDILDFRMQRGDFTVIDATNSKTSEMNQYKEMASKYRYRIFCVDMTTVPIEECKRRNKSRSLLKQVPDESIDKMYSRFATQKIPSGITVLSPDDISPIFTKKFDFNQYKRIHHVGDVHGCYTALMEYINSVGGIKDDEFWIFVGDFLDRGIENVETLKYFISIKDKRNVLMLDSNHNTHLAAFANGEKSRGREFELYTRPQIEASDIDMKDIRQLCRKQGQMAYYEYDGKTVVVTHGGISNIPKELLFVPTIQMIKGVGDYNDFETIAKSFEENTDENTYQIYGHRNTKDSPIQITNRCFNLEGKVEFGGYLRVVQLDKEGFHPVEIKNNVFNVEKEEDDTLLNSPIADVIISLRNNKYVIEKMFGNISSFNFNRTAFEKGIWDDQTVKARGLYINTKEGYVVARGYEKFFRVNEIDDTKLERLQQKMKFPIKCYKKENGYLGLISYNPETDDFFITTKSNPDAEFADWLKEAFYNNIPANKISNLKEFLKTNKVTLLFENVDMKRDPHIIKYDKNHLFLLDVVKNDMKFEKFFNYEELVKFAADFGMECKTLSCVIDTWQDFYDFYMKEMDEATAMNNRGDIEGYVIEDAKGFMVKMKLPYYNFWKFMRSISHEVIRKGYIARTSALTNKLSNSYYGWIKSKVEATPKEERVNIPTNIITLRDMFYTETGYKEGGDIVGE